MLNHVGTCWGKRGGGGLQVYIVVSEMFSKNTFSNLSITITSKNNQSFLEQIFKKSNN